MTSREKFLEWTHALDERHLSELTVSEAARALRALSSCYVERRDKLAKGDALGSAGKRAAFALFYAPLHFLVTRAVVQALGSGDVDANRRLGVRDWRSRCGLGARSRKRDLSSASTCIRGPSPKRRGRIRPSACEAAPDEQTSRACAFALNADLGVIAAYTVNELKPDARTALLPQLIDAGRRGSRILVLEPISRRVAPWWREWEEAFAEASGRTDEWRFPAALPERQAQLARAAGLDPKELTGRTLYL